MEQIKELLLNWNIALWVMAFIVFIATYIIKLPIKHFTNKIPDTCSIKLGKYIILVRRIINTIFVLIPFGLGIFGQWAYAHFLGGAFDIIQGLAVGTSSLSMYAIIERFLGIKLQNDNESFEGAIVSNAIKEISKDNKFSKDDKKAIKEAFDKLNKM